MKRIFAIHTTKKRTRFPWKKKKKKKEKKRKEELMKVQTIQDP